jgi:tetratricopeptide (TPR) repeat protein
MARSGLALCALLATLGCAGQFRFAACPAEGGRPWQELVSAHFRVRTDLQEADARAAALHLERMRSAVMAVAWPRARLPRSSPIQVVILRDRDEFVQLYGDRVKAFVSRRAGQVVMVMAGGPDDWTDRGSFTDAPESTAGHELVHQISALLRLRQPRWFAEGLASYLETVQISRDGSVATFGEANMSMHRAFMQRRHLTARDALAWNAADGDTYGLYATSWMLVHWLFNTRADQLAGYQARLSRGLAHEAAWQQSFPGLDRVDLDRTLYAYALGGRYQLFAVPIQLADPSLALGLLPEGDVHATRALLASIASKFIDPSQAEVLARAENAEALRVDPNNLAALLAHEAEADSRAERIALLRRATAAHPDSGVAWLTLAGLLDQAADTTSEAEAAYRKGLERLPDDDSAMNNLAWLYVGQGRYEEALPLSQRAVSLDPGSPSFLDTHAHVLGGLGRCPEALAFQRQAIAALADADERTTLEKHLRELERRCEPASSPQAEQSPPAE